MLHISWYHTVHADHINSIKQPIQHVAEKRIKTIQHEILTSASDMSLQCIPTVSTKQCLPSLLGIDMTNTNWCALIIPLQLQCHMSLSKLWTALWFPAFLLSDYSQFSWFNTQSIVCYIWLNASGLFDVLWNGGGKNATFVSRSWHSKCK